MAHDPARDSSLVVLGKVAELAAQVGLVGRLEEDTRRFFLGVDLGQGRLQGVYVRDSSHAGRSTVTVFSPGLQMEKAAFQALLPRLALDLLRANEAMTLARYGLIENDQDALVMASVDHLLDSFAPADLQASVFAVAQAADRCEREFGRDDY
jgi:hypothetical protein